MTFHEMKTHWIPLLLADASPCLRWLVLRELMQRPDSDGEVNELAGLRDTDPLVVELAQSQQPDGSWTSNDPASRGDPIRTTARALARLGYLGFGPDHAAVTRGAAYLFAQQRKDGSWPLPARREQSEGERDRGYSMMPLQTALPLRGLAMCGYATDPRAERAYEWLLAQRLSDGAWPVGIASGNYGYIAGYRRLAHSRWGCRSHTTGSLTCLALHPQRRTSDEARRALDLLLGRETREQHTFGFEVARLVGSEPAHGFTTFYARFDPAQLLDLCARIGVSNEDARVAGLAEFARSLQGPYGLWDYQPRPQASRWVTFDVLRSLARLGDAEVAGWFGAEPRTPFRTYPKRARRY